MATINANTNVTLDKIYGKIMNLQREDYAVPTTSTCIIDNDLPSKKHWEIMVPKTVDQVEAMPMTEHSREQLNGRWAGLNTLSKTLITGGNSDIYTSTVNELLKRDERKLTVRTMNPDGQQIVRAVVSDAFKPIDDNILLPDMLETIAEDASNWRSLGGQITETNTYLKFITREPQIRLNIQGRKRNLHVGFMYSNSEVGRGFTQFNAFMFDSFCENGCVFGSINVANLKFAHRGTRIETDLGRIMEERIQRVELAQIQGAVLDATRLAISGQYIEEVRNLIEASLNNKIPNDVNLEEFLKQAGKSVGLNDGQQQRLLTHYDGTANQFGVQAAITEMAQRAKTYEDRQELETAGGKIMAMKPKVWESITALAS